jgi:hypothetical protein
MPITHAAISTTTVTSAVATVTLSNIPQTYTDLLLLVSARNTNSGNVNYLSASPNNSPGTISTYYLFWNYNTGGALNASNTNDPGLPFGFTPQDSIAANNFGLISFYFPNYTSSSEKAVSVESVMSTTASKAVNNLYMGFLGFQCSTTSAITSLTCPAFSGNHAVNTTFSLYGIKKN